MPCCITLVFRELQNAKDQNQHDFFLTLQTPAMLILPDLLPLQSFPPNASNASVKLVWLALGGKDYKGSKTSRISSKLCHVAQQWPQKGLAFSTPDSWVLDIFKTKCSIVMGWSMEKAHRYLRNPCVGRQSKGYLRGWRRLSRGACAYTRLPTVFPIPESPHAIPNVKIENS